MVVKSCFFPVWLTARVKFGKKLRWSFIPLAIQYAVQKLYTQISIYPCKEKDEGKSGFYCCKLSAHKVIITFMESISYYLADNTGDLLLWHLKHKELIRLFSRYYRAEELQAFFHPMTGEAVPFRNLVLSHYMKANDTKELADLCGYGLVTFRRVFKGEFETPVYQWLLKNVQSIFCTAFLFPIFLFKRLWKSSTLHLHNNSTASVKLI